MPRGASPGERRGGRRKGSRNKATVAVAERLAALGCDPIEGMARIATRDVPCLPWRGTGGALLGPQGKVVAEGGREGACPRCLGHGREPVPYELRARMSAELAEYIAPKRSRVEHSGPDGEAIAHEHRHGTLPDYDRLSLEELQAELAEDMAGGA